MTTLNEKQLRTLNEYRLQYNDEIKHIIQRGTPPHNDAEFRMIMRAASTTELTQMGFGLWIEPDENDCGLFLFPAQWYDAISEGFPVIGLLGENIRFTHGWTDSTETKHGLLKFGIIRQIFW